ncbi:MAG: hypothetical protein JJT77_01085 [Crocinitomicaceae bacterium]|nr:hypothetical protein [Crocinitomicaceae bacterium]
MKSEEIYIIHPQTKEQASALKAFIKALKMKFEVSKDRPYNPEFVEKILESKKQASEGKTVKIDLDEIWKD